MFPESLPWLKVVLNHSPCHVPTKSVAVAWTLPRETTEVPAAGLPTHAWMTTTMASPIEANTVLMHFPLGSKNARPGRASPGRASECDVRHLRCLRWARGLYSPRLHALASCGGGSGSP